MLRKAIAVILAAALAGTGCASTVRTHVAPSPIDDAKHREEMSEYVQRLPIGARVRVERTRGGTLHGTLMSAAADRVVVQRATRIPEAPIEVRLDDVTRVQIEERANVTKIVALAAAAGAAATLGFLLFLATALND